MKVLLCAVFALFRPAGCLEIFQSFVIIAFYKILDISTEGRRIAPTPSTPQSLKDHNSLFLTGLNNTVMFLNQLFNIQVQYSTFSFPGAALFRWAPRIATSGKVQHWKSVIHRLPVTLRMLRVSVTNLIVWEYETNSLCRPNILDPARGRNSWCWPKWAWPLGTRIHVVVPKHVSKHKEATIYDFPRVHAV